MKRWREDEQKQKGERDVLRGVTDVDDLPNRDDQTTKGRSHDGRLRFPPFSLSATLSTSTSIYLCLPVYLPLSLSLAVCLSTCIAVCLVLYFCLSAYLCVCLSICLLICLPAHLPMRVPPFPSLSAYNICLPVCLSGPISLNTRPPTNLPACPPTHLAPISPHLARRRRRQLFSRNFPIVRIVSIFRPFRRPIRRRP